MNWRALEARVDKTLADAFGEDVRLSFLKNGAVDPDRPAIEVRAILCVGPNEAPAIAGMNMRVAAGQGALFLDRATYAGPSPKSGDKVRATDRAGTPWFEVANINDRETNLLVLALTAA